MQLSKVLEMKGHNAPIYSLDFYKGLLYTGSGDTFVAAWDYSSGVQSSFSIKTDASVFSIYCIESLGLLAIGSSCGSVYIVDVNSKKQIASLNGHSEAIFSFLFDVLTGYFYIGDAQGNLSVWSTDSWERKVFIPLQCGKIRDLVLVSGDLFIATQSGEIIVMETLFFNLVSRWVAHSLGVNCLIIHPSKKGVLVSGGKDGYIKCWDLKTKKELLSIAAHNFGVYRIIFMCDDVYMISASRDKTIKCWDASNMEVLYKVTAKEGGHIHAVNELVVINTSMFASVSDDKRIIVWELLPSC